MKRCSPRGLPDLAQLEPINSGEAGSVSLEAILRRVAQENRNGHLQLFYSIRSVADHFRVPSATISRIYRRLSADRILRMIWGSKTLLEPQQTTGTAHCRTIRLPVS